MIAGRQSLVAPWPASAGRRGRGAAVLVLLAGLLAVPAFAADNDRWVQYGPDGAVEARVVVTGSCPLILIDGASAPMAERASPSDDFPRRACAAAIPPGTKAAAIAGEALVLPVAEPRRILVVGDTGCRIQGSFAQACNDAAAWPFRGLAELAARLRPDLVIHVGDYHYRESPCPSAAAGCAGSPYGDNWPAWQADFFDPARALLAAAPWVFVRGNHEECARAGRGWSRMLDPGAMPATADCIVADPPYRVALGGLDLVVLDVAVAEQAKEAPDQVAAYRRVFAAAARLARAPAWLLLHRPIRGVVEVVGNGPAATVIGGNKTLVPAAEGAIPAAITLLVSGHIHAFEALDYDADLPPQLVVGHGGTYLDRKIPADPTGLVVDGVRIGRGTSRGGFGFVLLARGSASDWSVALYDAGGTIVGHCRLDGRDLSCGD